MYLTHVDIDGNLIFVMVLPFEQKHLAKQNGFVWNNVLPGAWATDNQSTALAAVKAHRNEMVVAIDTLNEFFKQGKMLAATYDVFYKRQESYQPDRKMKAAIEAATMSDDMITAVHTGLQTITSVCDGATTEDAQGFNRNDLDYGHSLAAKSQLTRTDAGYGKLLLNKYRRQLGHELYSLIFPEVYAREAQAELDKANKKAVKAAEKFHKKGKACDWSGCQQCTQMPGATQFVAAADYVQADEVKEVVQAVGEQVKDSLRDMVSRAAHKAAEKTMSDLQNTQVNSLLENAGLPQVQAVELSAPADTMIFVAGSQPLGHTEIRPGEAPKVKLDPEQAHRVAVVNLSDDQKTADPEIIRLATSLIDCFPGDFDAVVDMLRELRGVDAPKGGSPDVKQMWQAAGYKTK